MMDSDDPAAAEEAPFTPKLPRLTEWRTPVPDAEPHPEPPPPSRRKPMLLAGSAALAVLLAGAAWLLPADDIDGMSVALPAAEKRKADDRRRQLATSYAPINLPSGLTVDRSSTLNYELAAWLAPTPLSERTFAFDRVRFDPGSAALNHADPSAMQVLLQILSAYPQARVTIVGNGPGPLALARADAIRGAMLQLGADPAQLAISAGKPSDNAPKLSVKLEMGAGSDLDA